MKIVDEFKTFIAKGNVLDMAVGIIVGSAFTKIVNSLVADVITPVISLVTGKVNFTNLKYVISEATETTAENALMYGNFIQSVVDFLIIALVVFFMVKFVNKTKERFEHKEEEPKEPPKPSNEEILLMQIRDLLKDKES